MVLEYLEGPEYSIDCLATEEKLIAAIPRLKGSGRVRELVEHFELIQMAHAFHNEYKLPYVFNIQVKYNEGVPKLLEINPRMSGDALQLSFRDQYAIHCHQNPVR